MIVRSLNISNFRGIADLEINFHPRINVFVGENGVGKSSVLSCLVKMLSSALYRIYLQKKQYFPFSKLDLKNGADSLAVSISIIDSELGSYSWERGLARNGRKVMKQSELEKYVESIGNECDRSETLQIPVVALYPVNRVVSDTLQNTWSRHVFDSRFSGFAGTIEGSGDFGLFFKWFREREDYVNEQRVDDGKFVDEQFHSVCSAITALTDFRGLRIRRFPQRMLLEKGGETLDVEQLSDGEKSLMAMVGDMAMRLAVANPKLKDPLNAQAVFLVDEIDLHLHPAWQRMVMPRLLTIFPNSQFIVSTHSTQVLTHIQPESIHLLRKSDKGIVINQPEDSYGQTQDSLFEDLMDVPTRPEDIATQFRALYKAIDSNDLTDANNKLKELSRAIGADPDLVKAEILIRRKERDQ